VSTFFRLVGFGSNQI